MIAFLVCLFGGLGAASRFMVDGVIRARSRSTLPVATISINVTGSLLIGFLATAQLSNAIPTSVYLIAATGFCGGYTTFSTSMIETIRLAQVGEYWRALANTFGSLALTIMAAAAGAAVAWLIWSN